tara:strand:- start:3243 stop:3707 length:465 start_codon:yes stop_codon:yes gene_type:complete
MSISDIIETNFTKKEEILNLISNTRFFLKYMKIINPIYYKFIPEISNNSKVTWPLKIEYEDSPMFSSSNIKLPKILIKQKWAFDKDLLSCDMEIFMTGFNIASISLEFFIEIKKKINLKLKANWIYRNFLVSKNILNDIVRDSKKIINKIINDI